MIIPTSTGQVFVYDESSIKSDNPPIAKLDDNHIFVQFVKEFWHKITTPGAGDPLMNAYAMLLFDINVVPDACRQYICTQLRQTPPDIVLINDLNPLFLGFQRTPNVWPYISIHKAIVDRWADGMARFPNERQTLAAEALLKMTIVHEGGHWHYKLISIQRVGQYTNEMMHLQNGLPKTEGLRQYQALSAKQQEEIVKKHTFKSISVPWNSDKGESGYFSEYKAVGGIMGFDLPSETLFMRTNASHSHLLSTDYLLALRERGIFYFHPKRTAVLPQPIPKAKCKVPFWPDTDDTCSISPSDQPTEFVGLDFDMTLATPDCPSLEESRVLETNYSMPSFPAIPHWQ